MFTSMNPGPGLLAEKATPESDAHCRSRTVSVSLLDMKEREAQPRQWSAPTTTHNMRRKHRVKDKQPKSVTTRMKSLSCK